MEYCTREQTETHDAVGDVLMREDRLDSEGGDEKGKCHCESSAVRVRFSAIMSVS
jgi:hypothetical protein